MRRALDKRPARYHVQIQALHLALVLHHEQELRLWRELSLLMVHKCRSRLHPEIWLLEIAVILRHLPNRGFGMLSSCCRYRLDVMRRVGTVRPDSAA